MKDTAVVPLISPLSLGLMFAVRCVAVRCVAVRCGLWFGAWAHSIVIGLISLSSFTIVQE